MTIGKGRQLLTFYHLTEQRHVRRRLDVQNDRHQAVDLDVIQVLLVNRQDDAIAVTLDLQIQVGGSSAMDPGTLTQSLALEGPATAPAYHFVAAVVK